MSNSLAIAAVTKALSDLLQKVTQGDTGLGDFVFTAKPLDIARAAETHNQLNLFLYHTTVSAAERNMDMPGRARSGETLMPPLALNLYYLLTAYGASNDEVLAHRVLGQAMNLLHDNAGFSPAVLEQCLRSIATDAHRDLQVNYLPVEGARVTLQPLTLEDLSKLWTVFHSKYRLSVAYQVSVVLIESARPVRAPLPVLRRGAQDRGILLQLGTAAGTVALRRATPPNEQPSARLGLSMSLLSGALADLSGDRVTLEGNGLVVAGLTPVVNLDHPLAAHTLPGTASSASAIWFTLPVAPTDASPWPAGLYAASVAFVNADHPNEPPVRQSNVVSLAVAPRILTLSPTALTRNTETDVTVTCSPWVQPGQRVSLLVGDMEVRPKAPIASATSSLVFTVPGLPASQPFLRLLVECIDSLLFDYSAAQPSFDTQQQLVIT